MLQYILKRILVFVPTLLVISLLTFTLSVHSPGDPVEIIMNASSESGQDADKIAKKDEYQKMRHKLNLDLPVFYFSVSALSESDTLYKIPEKLQRENLARLVDHYGNWDKVSVYYQSLQHFENYAAHLKVSDSLQDHWIALQQITSELYFKSDAAIIENRLSEVEKQLLLIGASTGAGSEISKVKQSFHTMVTQPTAWKNYFPTVHWYGFETQYHLWLSKMLVGDFGLSYYKQQPVITMILERIGPTFMFSILSIIIAFAVSIPVGMNSAIHKGTKKDTFITILLFVLYSLPSFWIATLFINYFTNSEYLDWFPVKGLQNYADGADFVERTLNYAHHMVLPLFCYVYSSFAFISRQMRGSMLQTLSQDYIRTAWAKGLAPKQVYWKHAIRNSLLPIITLVASIFPSLIAGSIVIESLFTLPGLGMLAYEAEVIKDFPVIFTIMLLSAVFTLIGYLVSDILYALVDPRISYSKK